MNASVEVAVHLEELFDRPFSAPVSVLDGAEEVRDADPTPEDPAVDPDDEHVVAVLSRAGFTVHPTARSPFDSVTEDDGADHLLTGHSAFDRAAKKRAELLSSLGEVTRTRAVYFAEDRPERRSVGGTAIVACAELRETTGPEAVRRLVRERAAEAADRA
jgi:putative transcriptional regulator